MSLEDELAQRVEADGSVLGAVQAALPIVADLSRSDLLLYQLLDGERALVSAHARPHSVSSAYAHDQTGQIVARQDAPLVWRVLSHQGGGVVLGEEPGHSMRREVWPVRNASRRVVAALAVETIAVEVERHGRRSATFRAALRDLQRMLVGGEILGAENLTPFGEHDGILFVDTNGQVRYVSGTAENLYRKLGHAESILRHSITSLGTNESAYFSAGEMGRCFEVETREGELIWIRKALPVRVMPRRAPLQAGESRPVSKGILLTISDVTDSRRREQELLVKQAMIQEIHHRVKNNLQTIASLLRMQSRRIQDPASAYDDRRRRQPHPQRGRCP